MSINTKIKILGTVLGVLLFALLLAGATYAWFSWQSSNINISGKTECLTVNHTVGQTIENASVILYDESKIISDNKVTVKEGMVLTDVTAYKEPNCTLNGNLTISMNVTNLNPAFTSSGNSTGALKYILASYDTALYTSATVANLKDKQFDIIDNKSITAQGEQILLTEALTTTKKGYLIIFYVDGELAMNDAGNSNINFNATIKGVVTQTE